MGPMKNLPSRFATKECFSAVAVWMVLWRTMPSNRMETDIFIRIDAPLKLKLKLKDVIIVHVSQIYFFTGLVLRLLIVCEMRSKKASPLRQ